MSGLTQFNLLKNIAEFFNPTPKCIDESLIKPNAPCTKEYNPVLGCNGIQYSNPCVAKNNGVLKYTFVNSEPQPPKKKKGCGCGGK